MLSWQRQKQEYHVVSRELRFLHEASAIHHLVVIRNFVTAGAPTHHPVKHKVLRFVTLLLYNTRLEPMTTNLAVFAPRYYPRFYVDLSLPYILF